MAESAPTNDSYWDEDSSRVDTDWSGSGTQADPWLITSAAELAGLSYTIYNNTKSSYLTSTYYYYSGCYFKQTVDIDVSAYYWQPIGIYYNRSGTSIQRCFSGNYDGNDKTVSGIFTKYGSYSQYSYQGLFGFMQGKGLNQSTISNLGIVDSYIQGNQYIGAIAGYIQGGVITNCFNKGAIKGYGNYVGGLVGTINDGSITKCYNMGLVQGAMYIGGIVGGASSVTITNCFNTGEISGQYYIGGVAGSANSATITNCFNTGAIIGSRSNGGIIGYSSSSSISNCYYGGNCTLTIGIGSGSGTTVRDENLFNNAKTLSWYSDSNIWDSNYPWDFENIWAINSKYNDGYPVFKWQIPETWKDYAADSYAGGSGTIARPFIIKTPNQLAKLAVDSLKSDLSETYFELASDIDMSEHLWGGIVNFAGVLDGKQYDVCNIYNAEDDVNSVIDNNNGVIKNLILSSSVFYVNSASANVGALVANNYGTIQNCIIDNVDLISTCETGIEYIGVLCGKNEGIIINSIVRNSTIFISNNTYEFLAVGMIVGWQTRSNYMTNCASYDSQIICLGKAYNISSIAGFISWWDTATCFGEVGVKLNGVYSVMREMLFFNESDWTGWFYNESINKGIPIPAALLGLGGIEIPPEIIYELLISKGYAD